MGENSQSTSDAPSSGANAVVNWGDNANNSKTNENVDISLLYITTVFHVHMPKLSSNNVPAVLGSCESLGRWDKEKPRVLLKNVGNTLWISDPVKIPNNVEVKYKYAIFSKGYIKNTLKFEGEGEQADRSLELYENHYDIWRDNYFAYKIEPELLKKEYAFVGYIYEHISDNNLKDKLIEYQRIFEDHREYTRLATNLGFIKDRVIDCNTKEKRYFLFLLLGYYMSQTGKRQFDNIPLPADFPSDTLFEVLDDLSLISGTKNYVILSIKALTQHSSKYGSFEWFRMFTLAPELDEEYTFLEVIINYDYSKNSARFQKSLLDHVQPRISEIKQKDDLIRRVASRLLQLSYNLESLFFILNEVIGFDERLKFIVEKRINDFIKHDSPFQLYNHFQEVRNESQFDIKKIFRERLLKYLQYRGAQWEHRDVESLNNILEEKNLIWPIEDLVKILECVASSDQLSLLQNYLIILKLVLDQDQGFKPFFINKALATTYTWLPKLTALLASKSRASSALSKNIAFITFQNFSSVYKMVEDWSQICEELKKIVNNQLDPLSDDLIFGMASSVDGFEPDVIRHYVALATTRLDRDVQDVNDQLLKKIMRICDSKKMLDIKNEACEELLYHIFDCLQKNAPERPHAEDTFNTQISILESSNFWKTIFLSSGNTERLHSHPFVQETRDILTNLAMEIAENTITIGLLEDIFRIFAKDENLFIELVNSAVGDHVELTITDNALDTLRHKCVTYTTTFFRLDRFYTKFCSSKRINDYQKYIIDLQNRKEVMNNTTVENSCSDDHWGMHSETIPAADAAFKFFESRTFSNIYKLTLESETRELNVQVVAQEIIRNAIDNYDKACQRYDDWEKLKYPEVQLFWSKIKPEQVDSELIFLLSNCNIVKGSKRGKKLTTTVEHLVVIPVWNNRLQELIEALEIFEYPVDDKFWASKLLQNLKDNDLLLEKVILIFKDLRYSLDLNRISDKSWEAISEISASRDFIKFLKSLVGHDLKNLINGVDDHSDERLMQADTVSTFIQVKSILEPLLVKGSKDVSGHLINMFLSKFLKVTESNPLLANKVKLCNSNYQALKNMYENLSKRGEITKQRIKNCVVKGTYEFTNSETEEQRCTAKLSYHSNKSNKTLTTYSFADLQDLRGRALLIAKAPVDLALQIINVASTLIERHFTYRRFGASTSSTKDMEELLKNLTADLQEWDKIVNVAQKEHYYLTFYPARHILSFYDYFFFKDKGKEDGRKMEIITDTCEKLLRFVSDEAELPSLGEFSDHISREDDFLEILQMIGNILNHMFSNVPPRRRLIAKKVERITSNVVKPGQLFVAACNDKFSVPNIIMSLFSNYGYYPEPWQLLICKASTKLEELITFTKRCFFAVRNGYDNHLFCIANVEILEFELQYQLVNNIRSLSLLEKNFHLALICCREAGMHHHILEQFSQDVHFITKGLGAESMSKIYQELCPNVTCVSSDLSGQGKTEVIREINYQKGWTPRNLLISDGVRFAMLVRQLSELKLKKFESLHLNIVLIDHPYDVNMFLFELLSLGMTSNGSDIACLPSTVIFIEVASTLNQYLLNSLPLTGYLPRHHISWNINKLIVSRQYNSPIQIVSRYLDAHDRDIIDQDNILFVESQEAETLLPPKRCQQLLQKYFFDKKTKDVASYRFLEIFLDVFADQLVRMSNSTFFRIKELKSMVRDQSIRKTLLETLLSVSMEFSTRSIDSKAEQIKNLSDDMSATLGTIKPWEDSNHLLVVFLSQTPDSICALYRSKDLVPENVVGLLRSQHVGTRNFSLEDFENMSSEDIIRKL
ncbi:17097_t:CDS:2, partial [Acaulospora morrowiae]